jgi:four helix bundle protein
MTKRQSVLGLSSFVCQGGVMPFKFEKLEVWNLSLDYVDLIYEIADKLPSSEAYNLRSQMTRAATSIALNIAEGSTGQTDAEQARFLGLAIRSLLETVACQHLISRRAYLRDLTPLRKAYVDAETLVAKLHTMRRAIQPNRPWIREERATYGDDEGRKTEDGSETPSMAPW